MLWRMRVPIRSKLKLILMSYKLKFKEEAWQEWGKLDNNVRLQFKKKLQALLSAPRILASQLSGHPNRFKIKLRAAGYRLVYEVRDNDLVVLVVAIGKRERNAVYKVAAKR